MPEKLPAEFIERLKKIIPFEHFESVLKTFYTQRPVVVRINTLKKFSGDVVAALGDATAVEGMSGVYILANKNREDMRDETLVKEGFVYPQGLTSTFIAQALAPKPGERVLDLCAAPGSKTSHMAALMNNLGEIIAVEVVKDRFYKLKSVLETLGVKIVKIKILDGRKLRGSDLFDKILVDAPCSSEGRFDAHEVKTLGYWSERKIKEMSRKQRGLLLNASRLLKVGGTLIYSTCTFAPEENEAIVGWFLKKARGTFTVEPLNVPPGMKTYPPVLTWKDKELNSEAKNCLRVLPDDKFEGFFMAKIVRIK